LQYSKDLFCNLSLQQQLNVLYKLIRGVGHKYKKLSAQEATEYLTYVKEPSFARLIEFYGENASHPEQWLEQVLVKIERELKITVRDDQFLREQLEGNDRILFPRDDFSKKQVVSDGVKLMLHDLRSAFNVGAIFRNAECFVVEGIILSGFTPTPEQKQVSATAMGTEGHVSWIKTDLFTDSGDRPLIAFETVSDSKLITDFNFPQKCGLLFGNERFGLDAKILTKADHVVKIPMYGGKNSLNVSSAVAIALYEYRKQWSLSNLNQASRVE
jgi:23S rRNA (guanosine2251-2'-O)-methyltransferase